MKHEASLIGSFYTRGPAQDLTFVCGGRVPPQHMVRMHQYCAAQDLSQQRVLHACKRPNQAVLVRERTKTIAGDEIYSLAGLLGTSAHKIAPETQRLPGMWVPGTDGLSVLQVCAHSKTISEILVLIFSIYP